MPPFRFPYLLNLNYYKNKSHIGYPNPTQDTTRTSGIQNSNIHSNASHEIKKNNSKSNDTYFFELFGLKLYFDDVLLISILFFLYGEGVQDNELFFSLILLLLS